MGERQQNQSGQKQQPSERAEEDARRSDPLAQLHPPLRRTPHSPTRGQYNPREYQSPHPDDAAATSATTAGSSKTAKTEGGEATKKRGGKGDADREPCSSCGTLGATRKCSQCRQP